MRLNCTHGGSLARTFVVLLKPRPPNLKQYNTLMNFGTQIKDLRIRAGLTLRTFASRIGMDASNWSKIERGIIPPPNPEELIAKLSGIIPIDEAESESLLDLAALARKEVPGALLEDEALLAKMPAFFRAIKGREYTPEDMDKLIADIQRLNKP